MTIWDNRGEVGGTMSITINTGGVKEFNYSKEDIKRIESTDTESTKDFKKGYSKWLNTKKKDITIKEPIIVKEPMIIKQTFIQKLSNIFKRSA